MSQIGSISGLGTDQIRALNRLNELGRAISQNQQRLSTLRRINSASDDPSGLVKATLLETELKAAEEASQGLTQASALLSTADTAAQEALSQLQEARSLALAAAGGTLSSSEVAANQVQLDSILDSIDSLAGTEFNGRRLLDGTSGFRATGVDTATVLDVDVLEKNTAEDVTVSIDVTQQATQRTDQYDDGDLSSDTTLIVTGPDGTTTITLADGSDAQTIADAFNDVKHLTGITATRISGNDVDFTTIDYGSEATISIEATEGSFDTTTTQAGTDAVATINGQQVTADGTTFNVNTSELSLRIELDPSASGALSPFAVSGEGLEFLLGSSPTSTTRVGLGNLHTASLGGITGKLSSVRSGGTNTLTGGKAAEAVKIIDDAIADVTRQQAIIGGVRKFTLDPASRVLDSQIENLSSALSAVRDTDVALETARLANNQLLEKTTLETLSIINLRHQGVLNLLSTVSGGF